MKSVVLFVFVSTFFHVCICQNCQSVEAGLEPILSPCRESIASCVMAQEDLSGISDFFCIPEAEMQFNSFLSCTNRTFSDQIFGAICGGPNCIEGSFSNCQPMDGDRCFEQASQNNGVAAYQACMCSNESQNSSMLQCPTNCRSELQQLVEDIGCCTNTALYVYYFSTCGFQATGASSLDTIDGLFRACDLMLPPSCLHPFSTPSASVSNTVSTLFIICFSLLVAVF